MVRGFQWSECESLRSDGCSCSQMNGREGVDTLFRRSRAKKVAINNAQTMQSIKDLVMTEGLGRIHGRNGISLHMHKALSEFLQVRLGLRRDAGRRSFGGFVGTTEGVRMADKADLSNVRGMGCSCSVAGEQCNGSLGIRDRWSGGSSDG